MKPRWLLLGVSVLCLLVLFPASALSQQQRAELQATCGSARVDGVMSPGEWDDAAVVDLEAVPLASMPGGALGGLGLEAQGEVSPAQGPEGELLLMNDDTHLYAAVLTALDSFVIDPDYWQVMVGLSFTDEGDPLDGDWEAPDCDPVPNEGALQGSEQHAGAVASWAEMFWPYCQTPPYYCQSQALEGADWETNPGVSEWAIDLTSSELDKVGPGECFRFAAGVIYEGCEQGSGCGTDGLWAISGFEWPAGSDDEDPSTFGTLCLNPCEAEFVPEPGTLALLGSGLLGLAGYATLRLRSGQALRWRTRE